jgi:hypothetical protein
MMELRSRYFQHPEESSLNLRRIEEELQADHQLINM